jgi:hypothetical protein
MYNLDFKICQHLLSNNLEQGFNCKPDDIQYFRDTNDDILCDESVYDIEKEFIDEVIEAIDDKGWNYNKFETLVTGGGGKNLFDIIQKFFIPKAVLSNDPVRDNLLGLDAFAKKVFA